MTLTPGLIIAAPSSGSGKTVFTLSLLRLLATGKYRVASAKVGPDYIDPAFHTRASGRPCYNLDGWAMRTSSLSGHIHDLGRDSDMILAEGVMGLFDGAFVGANAENDGSTAAMAVFTGWPVVLVVDAKSQAQSVAALVRGFAGHDDRVRVAGVVFNRVGSQRHAEIIRRAMVEHLPDIPVLGCLPKTPELDLPERHLGLVQAREMENPDGFLDGAAKVLAENVDVEKLVALASPGHGGGVGDKPSPPIPPLGQRIAIARDDAFAFIYPSVLDGWRRLGCELSFFSPLHDEAADDDADAVYLPGGYPELFAGKLSGNENFLTALENHARKKSVIFGECGGYMVLGNSLTDKQGSGHKMAGLLDLETSFFEKKLHLGYRRLTLLQPGPLGDSENVFKGHEFHYSSIIRESGAEPLFRAVTADGRDLKTVGLRKGTVMGSFMHLIDQEQD